MIRNFKNGAGGSTDDKELQERCGREYWVCGAETGHQERRVGEEQLNALHGVISQKKILFEKKENQAIK
jgi:hypothetical protein